MAYVFHVVGWEDESSESHWLGYDNTSLPESDEVYGVFVHVYDPENPDDQHHFWAYTYDTFDNWQDWWDHIAGLCDMHGMGLA